jgi:hypothetical protein
MSVQFAHRHLILSNRLLVVESQCFVGRFRLSGVRKATNRRLHVAQGSDWCIELLDVMANRDGMLISF